MERTGILLAIAGFLLIFVCIDGGSLEGLQREKRGIDEALGLDCIPLNQSCNNMFYSCCSTYTCYREGGMGFNRGICVKCIQKDQKCQRNSQCCDYLKCQKSHALKIDGVCGPELADGVKCHSDSQCRGYCDKKFNWWPSGKCASYV